MDAKMTDNIKKILFEDKLAEKLQLSVEQHQYPEPKAFDSEHVSAQTLVQSPKIQNFLTKHKKY